VPPDTTIAAGLTHLVEAVNLTARFINRATGGTTDTSLFSLFGVPTSTQLSDPRVLYDAVTGRWFIVTITFSTPGSWNLAVSTTSDPTSGFVLYSYQTAGSFPDFPKIGINGNKVVLSGDAFSGNTFLGTEYLVLNKAELVSCSATPCSIDGWYYGPDQGQFAIEPAQHLPSTTTPANDNLYMAAVAYNSASSVTVWAVAGVPTARAAPAAQTSISLPIRNLSSPPNAAQCNSSKEVVTNDNALLDAVFRDGSPGYLWVAANDACTPTGDSTARSCARFIQIAIPSDTLTSSSIAQDFDVSAPGFNYYYPAVRTDKQGDMVSVFSGSSANVCPGVYAVEQFPGTPPTLSAVELVEGSNYAYTQASRWGDYSGIGVDPNDDLTFWFAGEYSNPYGCFGRFLCSGWGTWIANAP